MKLSYARTNVVDIDTATNHVGRKTLLSLIIALLMSAQSHAEGATRLEYAYCTGIAGNPRVQVVSPVFQRLRQGAYENGPSTFENTVQKKFGTGVREAGCLYSATAAEAEAKRKALIDGVTKALGPQAVSLIDWKPQAASASKPEPQPQTQSTPPVSNPVAAPATPTPSAPMPVAATKGLFVVCNGIDLPAGKLFFNPPVEVTSGDANAWSASYAKYLLTNYKYDRNVACNKLPTLAEAQSYYKETSDARRGMQDLNGNPAPLVITSWKYP